MKGKFLEERDYVENVPEGWKWVKLGDIADVRDGTHDSPKEAIDGKYLITSKHIKNGKIDFSKAYKISLDDFEAINKRSKVDKYDILFSMIGTIGEMVIVDFEPDFAIKNVGLFKTGNKDLSKWIYYYLKSNDARAKISVSLKGSTQRYITLGDLRNLPILLPPPEEQKVIADILSTVQNAIEKTEKVINATKQLKKSMMKHLFTYGAVAVDEIDKVKLKESEIGLIPEHWEVVRLGEVGNYINGYAFKPSDWSNTGKPIIRIQNLNNPSASFNYYNGELDYKYLVKKGDVLISWSASLGAYLWNGEDAWLNQHIFKVELTNQNVAKDYLYFALLYYFVGQAFTNLHGSTMKHIVKSKFLNILIPLPPLDEQQKIANILTTIDQKIQTEEKKKQALQNLFKTLLQQLITGKIRVKKTKT